MLGGASSLTNTKLRLSDGKHLEVVRVKAAGQKKAKAGKPPLLFVHGSYHAAWCWQEHFQPHFSAAGFDSWAVSLRGQGGSDRVVGASVTGTLDSHAQDLAEVVAQMDAPPVMVAHSFGGLIAQKYLLGAASSLAGAALLASVPPSGNRDLILRWLRRDLKLSWRVTWAFVGRSFATSVDECTYTFFSDDLPQADAVRYQQQLAQCSPGRLLDLRDMQKQVPLPRPPPDCPPVFVAGGETDRVLDVQALQELASHYNTQAVVLPRTAHDVMLDTRWEAAASALQRWLDETYPSS